MNVSCSGKPFSNVSDRCLQCCSKPAIHRPHLFSFVRITFKKAHFICSTALCSGVCNLCCCKGQQLLQLFVDLCALCDVTGLICQLFGQQGWCLIPAFEADWGLLGGLEIGGLCSKIFYFLVTILKQYFELNTMSCN